MGFFKELFFSSKKESEVKLEKELETNIKSGADYSCALIEQKVKCSGCGQDIEGKPRIKNHQGKTMYFHKRCWKGMLSGNLPKPIQKDTEVTE